MALTIQFTGFLQEVKNFDWGTVVEVAHTNRKKNQAGQWETVSTDYIDVVIDSNEKAAFAHILSAPKSTRLAVNGTMKFNTFEKRDGSTAVKMKVWPSEIDVVGDAVAKVKHVLEPVDAPF